MSNKGEHFLTEEDFYKFLDGFFPEHNRVVVGRGDDCGLIHSPDKLLISSDLFLEGIHFDMSYFPPFYIGYKSLSVNISDILAMGGIPIGFSMDLMLTKDVATRSFFREFFMGMSKLCKKFGLTLVGGDISWSNTFGVSITIFGEVEERYLPRGSGCVGDLIFITGDVGLSRAGFYGLKMGLANRFKEARKRHLMGNISYMESLSAIKNPHVTSLMDVSDGVFKDIKRLVPKGCGANLDVDITIVHKEVKEMAELLGEDPIFFALKGGEDYVLMGTCKREGIDKLKKDIKGLKIIGEVISEENFFINGKEIGEGFDHFKYREDI